MWLWFIGITNDVSNTDQAWAQVLASSFGSAPTADAAAQVQWNQMHFFKML